MNAGEKMKYGYFDDEKREYVITNPKTPVKWINYVGNIEFGGFVDQTGGSLICKGDPALNRITKYIPQMPASDFKGETLYIRINENGRYKIFSPYFVPTLNKMDLYECHIGTGYSRIVSVCAGIKTDVLIFAPSNENRLIRKIKVTNISDKPVCLDIIPVVEYTHFDALKQFTNADWVPQTMQSKYYDCKNGLGILTQFAFMNKDNRVNYLTSNYPISSFETDRKLFLGDNEYGTWKEPLSLYNNELQNSEAQRGDNIGALMHHLGVLNTGESKTVITQLGQCENIEAEKQKIEWFRNEKNVDESFNKLLSFWDKYFSVINVDTPDDGMNRMLNIYNARQCYITESWSRYLSLYQLGFGARGIGFRDSAQDVMAVMPQIPEDAKKLICKLLSVQKRTGSAMHQFNPLTMEANEGDSRERDDRPHYYGDDHLWIVLAVCAYLKETGNIEFLNEKIPFYDGGQGSVLEHLKCAIDFTEKNKGQHGLPLLGFADWNDTVNLPYGAESVFIAELYGKALMEMMDLFEFIHDHDNYETYKKYYSSMKESVNNCAWDGKWFIRYFDDKGNPLGSDVNKEGKIYINSQTWAVISGFAEDDRGKNAMDSVNRILATENGIKLSSPPYSRYDPEKGGVTTYPKGAKENGGIFLHCNPWAIIAETMLKNGDRAFNYYNRINPIYKNENIDRYECEPYCYAQNILSDDHKQFGLARNSWLSGTASWIYQAGTQHILGIMPEYKGLKIDPCIPKNWDKFKFRRKFRGAVIDICVFNNGHRSSGVKHVKVDGREIDGNIVPVFSDNALHKVEVIM